MDRIGMFGPAILLTVVAFAVAYHFVQPALPRHIVMATGSKDGVYYYYLCPRDSACRAGEA